MAKYRKKPIVIDGGTRGWTDKRFVDHPTEVGR